MRPRRSVRAAPRLYPDLVLRSVHWLFILRAACLLALGTSVALLIDYTSAAPSFCGGESGCGEVRQSGLGYVVVPGFGPFPYLPALGVVCFSGLFAISMLPSGKLRGRLGEPVAYGAALGGVALIALQAAVLGTFCYLCMIVDIAALAAALSAFMLRGEGWEQTAALEDSSHTVVDADALSSEGARVKRVWGDDSQIYSPPNPLVKAAGGERLRLRPGGWVALAVLAVLIPVAYPELVRRQDVPPAISELYAPGKINVVEFFDVQCLYCQSLAPELEQALEPYEGQVHFVRQHVPLPHHAQAREASRYVLCAQEQGRGEDLARALFASLELEPDALAAAARELKLDEAKLGSCLASERPDAAIEAMARRSKDAGVPGLPTTFIGGTRIAGAQPREVYEDALARAARGEGSQGLQPWLFWLAAALLVVAVAVWAQPRTKASRASQAGQS